jgi:hypothetical protein
VPLICEYCKTPFDRPHTKGPPPKFHSDSCRQLAYQERRAAKKLSQRPDLIQRLREGDTDALTAIFEEVFDIQARRKPDD